MRLLLGVGEAPTFPAYAKAVGLWFPRQERGLCTSTFDGAAKFSNVIGIPAVAFVVTQFGWQGAFWFTGILSALYAVVFWVFYRNTPREHFLCNEAEAQFAEAHEKADTGTAPPMSAPI